MKKGVALLATLGLVLALSLLLIVSFELVGKSAKQISDKRFLIQSDIIAANLQPILDATLKDIKNADTLEMLMFTPIHIEDESSGLSLDIKMESAANKLNINTLWQSTQPNPQVAEFFEQMLDRYKVADRQFFLNILYDTFDTRSPTERQTGSKIYLQDQFFRTGRIDSMEHFWQIVDYYSQRTGDKSIYNIPWSKILTTEGVTIDFNYMGYELLKEILPHYGEESLAAYTTDRFDVYKTYASLDMPPDDIQRLRNVNVGFYIPVVHCRVFLKEAKVQKEFAFNYDIASKRVSNFDIAY